MIPILFEMDKLQRAGQTGPTVNNNDSDVASISLTDSSEQILASISVSASSSHNTGEDVPVVADITKFVTAKDPW